MGSTTFILSLGSSIASIQRRRPRNEYRDLRSRDRTRGSHTFPFEWRGNRSSFTKILWTPHACLTQLQIMSLLRRDPSWQKPIKDGSLAEEKDAWEVCRYCN